MSRKQPHSTKAYLVIAGLVVLSGVAAAGAAKAADQRQEASRARAASETLQAARPQSSSLPSQGVAVTVVPTPAATTPVASDSWPPTPAAPQLPSGSMAVVSSSSTARQGDKLTVALYAASGETTVNAVQAKLTYDTARLQFSEVAAGSDFATGIASNTQTPGAIRLARASAPGVSGTRLVAVLHFTAASAGTATFNIETGESLLVAAADATNILSSVRSSSVIVQ